MNEELKEAKEESMGLGGERIQTRGHGKFETHAGSLLTGDRASSKDGVGSRERRGLASVGRMPLAGLKWRTSKKPNRYQTEPLSPTMTLGGQAPRITRRRPATCEAELGPNSRPVDASAVHLQASHSRLSRPGFPKESRLIVILVFHQGIIC